MSDVIDVVLETTVIEVVQDGLVVEVAEEPVAIEIVGGGLELAAEIIAALNAANAPSAANPYATIDDLDSLSAKFPLIVPVTSDWASAGWCIEDVRTALAAAGLGSADAHLWSMTVSLRFVRSGAVYQAVLKEREITHPFHEVFYAVAWGAVPQIGEIVHLTSLETFDAASTDDLTSHNSSASAHAALNSRFDLAGTATAAVATHAADSGAHRNYARIMMMGA